MTNTKPSRSFQKFSNPWKVSKYQPHSTFQNLLKASIGELSCLPLSPSSSSDVHNHHHSKSTSRKQLWSGGQDFYQGQVIPHEKSSMEKNPNWANLSTPLPPWQRHPYPPPVNHADASKSSSTIHLIAAPPLSQFLQQLSRYWAPFSCTPRRQTPLGRNWSNFASRAARGVTK